MTEDVGARTVEDVIDVLARRLGLVVDRRRGAASGDWQGVGMQLSAASGLRMPGSILRLSAGMPHAVDLSLEVCRAADEPWPRRPGARSRPPRFSLGDAELDAWLEVRGTAEPGRAAAWLGPPAVRAALRSLDDARGLTLDRWSVGVFLDEDAHPDVHESVATRLREAALALDAARGDVPPSATSAPWVATFEELVRALDLRLETCPLAAVGRRDAFDVRVAMPGWGPFQDGMVLIDVSRPGAESPPWDLPPPEDSSARRLARAGLRVASRLAARLGVGEVALERLRARVRARPPLGLPPGFAVASARDHRIVAATRLAPGREPPLAFAVERLIAALRSGPHPRPAPRPSPYR